MKSFARASLVSLALVAPWTYAAAPDPSLIGCWRAVKIVLHAPTGPMTEDTSGRCTLQFKDDEFESACATSRGSVKTTYRYQIVRPGFYLATMVGSTLSTDLVGSTREYEYHVDGDRLTTVTNPLARLPATPSSAGRLELEAARTPCQ